MNQDTSNLFPSGPTLSGPPEGILLCRSDYLRLRELVGEDELAEELDRAIVVPVDRMPENVVSMHSRVTYVDEKAGTRREVTVVYPDEADPATGRISVLAPVGCALLGLAVGQTIDWEFPDGRSHRLRVEQVQHPTQPPCPGPSASPADCGIGNAGESKADREIGEEATSPQAGRKLDD